MRKLALTIWLASSLMSPNHGRQNDGIWLANNCAINGGPSDGLCMGYAVGVAEALISADTICPAGGLTNRQVQRVVQKYLSDHSDVHHQPAILLATAALKQAFACRK